MSGLHFELYQQQHRYARSRGEVSDRVPEAGPAGLTCQETPVSAQRLEEHREEPTCFLAKPLCPPKPCAEPQACTDVTEVHGPNASALSREVFHEPAIGAFMLVRWAAAVGCLLVVVGILSGCATSTLETRKQERWSAYAALSEEERRLVDTGQIQTGMSEDAVFLSWGKPVQILEQQNETGRFTTWLYQGSELHSDWYWRSGGRGHARGYFRHATPVPYHDIHDYVKAEVVFSGGKVLRWQTLPRPAY